MIPDITKEIGGVIYTLRFSARTSIAIEQEFGCKLKDLAKTIGKEPNVETVAKLTKFCMRKDGKMLTDAEFEEVLDQVSVDGLAKILNDAMGIMQAHAGAASEGDTGN